ncbi:MAG: VWA domain-containing protein, partial [Lentisphaerae bacterium]|nr:VWA domain-containing protein [Lentisphaerota bacterium]
ALAGYAGVVIENTRADRLGAGALQMIEAWVRHAGGGLLLTGGRNAFGVGGYYRSALEPALPVTMELRREHRKFSMAIVVALDRSGSMMASVPGGKTKMDLANLGTVEVLNMLSGQDEMGVIAVDSLAHVVVNRAPVDTLRGDERRILGIQSMGGGIFIYEALKAAARELNGSTAGVRHILLFADAADSEEPGNYQALVATAAAAGITVSVVGLGTPADSDAALLKDIAERGGGRCFFTDNAQEVPRLFAQDTFMVARNTWVTNAAVPRFTVALPQLSDALPSEAPPVGGYNLCYLRPEATAVAVTRDENEAPLVALRRHGTGRSAVFTGEADGAEAGAFARWSAAGEFYGALARYCAGPRQEGVEGLLALQTPIPGGVRITVYADTRRSELRGLNDVAVETLRHQPGLPPRSERLPLPWRTADTMAIDIPLTGGETLLATVVYPDGRSESLPPVCQPYSPEHAPAAGSDGAAALAALAEATGGAQLADVGSVWEAIPRGRRHVPLAPFFYLLAAVLFLFEVFERRTGWLDGRLRRRAAPPAASDAQPPTPSPSAAAASVPLSGTPAAAASAPPPAPSAGAPAAAEESPLARAKRRARERTG